MFDNLSICTTFSDDITGKVKTNKGQPLGGASVAIKDSYDGATSDSLGNYTFTTTEKGEKILVTSSIGYKVTEQKITIGDTEVTHRYRVERGAQ